MFIKSYIDPVAEFGFRSVLKATLMIDVVHDARWQHREVELMFRRFVVQTVAPVTTVNERANTTILNTISSLKLHCCIKRKSN